MSDKKWSDEFVQRDNLYIECKLRGIDIKDAETLGEVPDYVNDSQAISDAEAILEKKGLTERYEETKREMGSKNIKSSWRAAAIKQMFLDMEREDK